MRKALRPHIRVLVPATLVIALVGLLVVASDPARTDDRDLLRFSGAKPYLFILLDTSASMNFQVGADEPLLGYGDNPESRLYAAKEALFNVFRTVDDVQFGFAFFNQDHTFVRAKHWFYYTESAAGGGWPLSWPFPDPDGLTQLVDTDGDSIPDTTGLDVEGDPLTFGPAWAAEAGSCGNPLDLDDALERARANTFAKQGGTILWVEEGGVVARVTVTRLGTGPPGNPLNKIGLDNLQIKLDLDEMTSCSPLNTGSGWSATLSMRLDRGLGTHLMVDGVGSVSGTPGVPGDGGSGGVEEPIPGFWDYQDVISSSNCGNPHPFSGKGWEGNYDSNFDGTLQTGDPVFDAAISNDDHYCLNPADPSTCVAIRPIKQTAFSPLGRPLDGGDMIPFDWQGDNRDEFLRRLAPNVDTEGWDNPNFGVAYHLTDAPGAAGVLEPRFAYPPLIGMGESPIGKSILDFRCWYTGTDGSAGKSKCGHSAYPIWKSGWSTMACDQDPEYGCRRPYLIVISDGMDTCPGENPAADTAAMWSKTGLQTWGLNLGDPKGCKTSGGGVLHSVTTNGKGECINISNKDDLRDTIEDILGQIREESRTFASAAVPTVRAAAAQSVYISNFTPLRNQSRWDGHLHGFTKPLPLNDEGRPDTESDRHIWDVGEELVTTQYNAADFLGNGVNQRRVFYSMFTHSGNWPRTLALFDPVDCTSSSPPGDRCLDFLTGLGIWDLENPPPPDWSVPQASANMVIQRTLEKKTHTFTNPDGSMGDTIEYLLGDVFHSNPLVTDSPVHLEYFRDNLGDDGTSCRTDDNGNPGYRCFWDRHKYRRRVVYVGSNDGMLHALDAGRYDAGTKKYDNGTGRELFAYIPREVLPAVKDMSRLFNPEHHFTVDGSPVAADVFIDPLDDGGGFPNPDHRRWRSVVMSSLREGGKSYFALDVTQPDRLTTSGDDIVPVSTSYVPTCLAAYDANECGSNAYPAALWEFFDTTNDSVLTGASPPSPLSMDEDDNGALDLAYTWSTPNIGRIQVCTGSSCDPTVEPNDVEDRFVAVFGGGMDPANKTWDARDPAQLLSHTVSGNWLFMVDMETGKVLYKRALWGAAPMDAAAVDTDVNGYLDRIYIGTLAGYLYRVDLGPDSAGKLPAIKTETVDTIVDASDAVFGAWDTVEVQRITTDSNGLPAWEPRIIFDANWDGGVPTPQVRPLYMRPSVVFVGELGYYAVAFGTGDREDLWTLADQPGRFYLFVDDTTELVSGSLPLTEDKFLPRALGSADLSVNLLASRPQGEKGWYLALGEDERITAESFSIFGVTYFSTFSPQVVTTSDPSCDPLNPPPGGCPEEEITCGRADTDNLCTKTGNSNLCLVKTINGDHLLQDATTGTEMHCRAISGFVTPPFTEIGTVKDAVSGDGEDGGDDGGDQPPPTADDMDEQEIDLMNSLMDMFPPNCRFTNQRIDVKTVTADTRIERIVAVPVCLAPKNWKEW